MSAARAGFAILLQDQTDRTFPAMEQALVTPGAKGPHPGFQLGLEGLKPGLEPPAFGFGRSQHQDTTLADLKRGTHAEKHDGDRFAGKHPNQVNIR